MFRNLLLTFFGFCLSFGVFYFTVTLLDPFLDDFFWGVLLFFLSLFCLGISFFTLFFFFLSELWEGRTLGGRYFFRALRRGGILSGFVLAVCLLRFFSLLALWDILILFLFFILVELVFVTAKN